ncbi:hypothetical protein QBC41DRAFT_150349 [Cercophora samala]|uniref:Uncharacterized protein n=1 Tax=Cercophora samala TaxID=330535 RepID=A0AA39Z8V2_9PEZI|nr:hypothetical protein QBC41DRAFT_150349 [Cercophora samala]
MLSTITRLAGFLALLGAVHGAPAPLDKAVGFEGFEIVPVQWNLPINLEDPTGKQVTVTGTIQEAIAKMDASFPGWHKSFEDHVRNVNNSAPNLASALVEPETWDCNVPGEDQSNYRINQGVEYLRSLSGKAVNNPGKCGRVSCSYHTGIYWCNEDTVDMELEWGKIADGAKSIIHFCQEEDDKGVYKSKGIGHWKDKYSVRVQEDWDNC